MISTPKILIVGTWKWKWYQEACAKALRSLNCEIERFGWFDDFYHWKPLEPEPYYKSFFAKVQNHFLMGPILYRINQRLLKSVRKNIPDIIWFYSAAHIFPSTIKTLRTSYPQTKLIQYSNDNPFGLNVKSYRWRHLNNSIPFFDLHFVYRESNKRDFINEGARNVRLLRAYYIPEENYRVSLTFEDNRFKCDVIFAGHFELDERVKSLEEVIRAGHQLNLFGGGWHRASQYLDRHSPLIKKFPIKPVVGQDYRKAISGAKIALCFLSKNNKDTYTRRNFEIPAMKTFMLSEYTEDLASLFKEGVEAEYFRSRSELLDKISFYLKHQSARDEIARNGYKCLIRYGHDVTSRMSQFLADINEVLY